MSPYCLPPGNIFAKTQFTIGYLGSKNVSKQPENHFGDNSYVSRACMFRSIYTMHTLPA